MGRFCLTVNDLWKYLAETRSGQPVVSNSYRPRPDRPMCPHSNIHNAHGLPAHTPAELISDIKTTIKPKKGHTLSVTKLTKPRNLAH
jgi:hypothetical protein